MRSATGPRVVKKYGNRRLYDTSESRYVTLDELAVSVRGGADLRVIDAQSGGDITQTVLLQIIIESRGAAQFLSVPILTQLVRMSDDALGDFLGRWLSSAMELYQQARSGITSVVPYNPLAVPYAAGNLLARVLNAVPSPWMAPHPHSPPSYPGSYPDAPPPEVLAESAQPAGAETSLESLQRELDALKRSLRGDATISSPQRTKRVATKKTSRSTEKRSPAGKPSGR